MRYATALLLTVVLVLLWRGFDRDASPLSTPATGNGKTKQLTTGTRPERRDPTSEQRRAGSVRAALFSIEYHTMEDPPEFPEELRIMDPRTAAEILHADAQRSEFGESRRRRNILKLATGGLDLASKPPLLGQPEALEVLLGKDAAWFCEAMQASLARVVLSADFSPGPCPPLPPGPPIPTPPVPLPEPLTPEQLHQLRLQLHERYRQEFGPAIKDCSKSPPVVENYTELDDSTCADHPANWQNGAIAKRATLDVVRPGGMNALSVALDPQNWDAKDSVTGAKCYKHFTLAHALDEDREKDTCPPRPGTDWNQPLHEEFVVSTSEAPFIEALFHTVLAVDADREPDALFGPGASVIQATSFEHDYCLDKSFKSSASYYEFGPVDWTGFIDVDEGFVRAKPKSGETGTGKLEVEAVKVLRFRDWTDLATGQDRTEIMNESAGIALRLIGEGTAEGVCCRPPPLPACPDPPPPGP